MSSISLEQNSRHVKPSNYTLKDQCPSTVKYDRDQSAQQLNRNACSSQDKNTKQTLASQRRNSNHSTASSSANSASDAVKPQKQATKASKNKERRQRARNDKKSSANQKPENCKQPLEDQVEKGFTLDEKSSQPKNESSCTAISDASTNHNDSDNISLEDDAAKQPKRKFKNAAERIRFVRSYQKKLKTEMCKNWEMHGTCKWMDKCSFAHGAHELSKKKHLPRNFKSKICEQYHKTEIGFCAYGNRCQFLHSQYNILQHDVEQFSYTIQLMENARISKQRFQQIELSDELIYVNVFSNEHQQQSKRLSAFEIITSSSSVNDDNIMLTTEAEQ